MEEEDEGVQCHDCKSWAHLSCTSLTPRAYDFLKEDNPSIAWACPKCLKGEREQRSHLDAKMDAMMAMMGALESRFGSIESKFGSMDSKFEDVNSRLARLEHSFSEEKFEKKDRGDGKQGSG